MLLSTLTRLIKLHNLVALHSIILSQSHNFREFVNNSVDSIFIPNLSIETM
jgi:hypothetical protein